ncbi:amidohydrolase family protein [Amycolatopsis bartoniae]|uniref:2-pyrone-4,6-dicarboxylate hydrolase n=1 Tax=Amycolatopsis bartoniae TaxID=941986 RepID=A0A8H9J0R8_9PSEU|nr:amidohydrolase family protein [Amycolatopsis bartoniae]TVT07084.1 amidohydrolase family protein [Amycolatopsis bartoniae]GHF80776.1 2-pyrone-4,6-dicarboxylate hydrolase [Amycolatopsis bartoniae]
MSDPANPGPDPDPKPPLFTLPPGSCDSHCHIFGPTAKFPYAPERTFTPPEAPLEDLQRLHGFLGFERAVIVQSACHGTDHSALLDALGRGEYRGVALVKPETPDVEIARLHEAGVRGARLHFTPHLGPAPSAETIRAIVDKIRPYGWHLALHVAGEGIADHEDLVRSLPLRVVIDHLARVDLRQGLGSRAVTALRRLLDTGSVWVKLSGTDRIATAPPDLGDAAELAKLLATHAPERVVWGTDFPHPNTHGFVPNDGDLVNLLAEIAPDEAALRRLLVDNPTICFDF